LVIDATDPYSDNGTRAGDVISYQGTSESGWSSVGTREWVTQIETQEPYNVPPDILNFWRGQVGTDLLPVQKRAIKEVGLFPDGNLIVFWPTSSGKIFVGEMPQ
jgi:superfamily II helicase